MGIGVGNIDLYMRFFRPFLDEQEGDGEGGGQVWFSGLCDRRGLDNEMHGHCREANDGWEPRVEG